MKIAISSTGPDLQSQVDPRFGRCQYLVYYDSETGTWTAEPNTNMSAAGGAGIRTAQSVLNAGAEAVITGNIGPNAMQVLSGQAKVYTGFSGTVEQAVQALKENTLASSSSATVGERAGFTGGPGGFTGGPGGFTGGPGGFTGGGFGGGGFGGGGRGGGRCGGRGGGRGRGQW
jgi:predicted Fe-Mo cluster-binding NifX family protein